MARVRTTVPTRPSDPRAARSIEALCSALLDLIEHRPFDQITIKDITETAKVSYPTFFRRFASREELLEHIATEEVRVLLSLRQEATLGGEGEISAQKVCEYIGAHKKLWRSLLTGGAASAMRNEFMRIAGNKTVTMPRANPWIPADLSIPLVTSSIFEILAWWMRQPDDYPTASVVMLFDILITEAYSKPRKLPSALIQRACLVPRASEAS